MHYLAACLALVGVVFGSQVCVDQNCAPRNLVADFVFLIDSSEALSQDDFEAVKEMLMNLTNALTISPTDSQVAVYTYATRVRSGGLLKDLNNADAIQQAIQALQYDGTEDRQLYLAIQQEETDITEANGFRPSAKKVLVVIEGDEFTGQSPFNKQLDTVRAKFDMILVVGVGEQAIRNNYENTKKLAGDKIDVFWAYNTDHLTYVQMWIQNNACSNSHVPPTTAMPTVVPTQDPSVPCAVNSVNYDVYLVVDSSTGISASGFDSLKAQLLSFVGVYPLGDSNLNFALITIANDAQLYYTGFHQPPTQDRSLLLSGIQFLNQDVTDGQALLLALRAITSTYLSANYPTPNKLVVYLTGNTNFDKDPLDQAATMASQYGVQFLAVKWASGADTAALTSLTGAAKCVYDATSQDAAATATWLQTQLCQKQFCR